MKKKFGDDYYIVIVYEIKALNWFEVKVEDSIFLDKFYFFYEM